VTEKKTYACPFCGRAHDKSVEKCPVKLKAVPETFRLEGEILDKKYKLERRIAEGGMGVVYEGTHLTIGRKLAVKVLHTEIKTQDDVVARFQNEARLAAAIGQRNIVDIIDLGQFKRKFNFIVMEFLEGQDLRTLLQRRHCLTSREAVDIAMQVLSGLKAAHIKGIIHRDLKPENVFIVEEPSGEKSIKILDFGVSRLVDGEGSGDIRLTLSGMVFGTPRYIPPEQAKGKSTVDHRADLYSMGAILYEMLCGTPLCQADNYNELMVEILTTTPVPLRERARMLPPGLSEVVMKAVAKKPEERHQTAEAFMRALAPFSSVPAYMTESFTFLNLQMGPEAGEGRTTGAAEKAIETIRRMDTMPPTAGEEAGAGGRTGSQISTLRPRESGILFIGSRRAFIIGVPILLAIVAMSLVATFMAYKDRKQDRAAEKHGKAAGPAPRDAAAGKAAAAVAEIAIENLPASSSVYVDGVLHPERPVLVQTSASPRQIRIASGEATLFTETVIVLDDVSLSLPPAQPVAGGTQPGDRTLKKKKGGKGKKGDEIDEAYPLN
jgi:predicted Ser/Thr protein kinase